MRPRGGKKNECTCKEIFIYIWLGLLMLMRPNSYLAPLPLDPDVSRNELEDLVQVLLDELGRLSLLVLPAG